MFSIKGFHRNLTVWNFPWTMIFVSLNTAMAQLLWLFNCIPFHCLQGLLLFKVIKNLPWNPDKAHMDRPHSVSGHNAYNAGNKHLSQMLITYYSLLLNGYLNSIVRAVHCNLIKPWLLTLGWYEGYYRSHWLQRQVHLDGGMCSVHTQVQSDESCSHSLRDYRHNSLS